MSEPRETSNAETAPVAPLMRLGDALGEMRADANAAHDARNSGTLRGPITSLPRLDNAISHALAPGLHGVYGNSGSGKTAFAMQVAANCGFPALYVTCEMAPSELLRRHTARATGTFLDNLKSGEMSGADVETLALRAVATSPDLCLLDATRAPAPVSHLRECAVIAKGAAPHVLIVIDSLQTWAESLGAGAAGEYEILNAGIAGLRKVAHDLRAPILFISERNRRGNETTSGGLNSGAGTRKIEYSAETVFDLDRDMGRPQDGAGEFELTLRIVKNRHGSIGVPIPLLFNGALQQFRELNTREAVDGATASYAARTGRR
jgi:replicative DNA helicase